MRVILAAAAFCTLWACDRQDFESNQGTDKRVDYATLLIDPSRYEGDSESDAHRKPDATLAFIGVAPGMSVFELEAGAGYYTELFSLAVGKNGTVVMQNPKIMNDAVREEIALRLVDDRLANVRTSVSRFDALEAEAGSVDIVTWFQGPHDLYFVTTGDNAKGDPAGSFEEIYRILKPGGVLAVIDHAAPRGSPAETGDTLHRLDKDIVIRLATSAGLTLEAESDLLANPDDPMTNGPFHPSIRGKTNQFMLLFEKPD